MDGKGRFLDNIFIERLWRSLKYEEVFTHAYASVAEARRGIGTWLSFYNDERKHQALEYRTPSQIFAATRHREKAKLFVARNTAPDVGQLARQMTRIDDRRAASHFFHREDRGAPNPKSFGHIANRRVKKSILVPRPFLYILRFDHREFFI